MSRNGAFPPLTPAETIPYPTQLPSSPTTPPPPISEHLEADTTPSSTHQDTKIETSLATDEKQQENESQQHLHPNVVVPESPIIDEKINTMATTESIEPAVTGKDETEQLAPNLENQALTSAPETAAPDTTDRAEESIVKRALITTPLSLALTNPLSPL